MQIHLHHTPGEAGRHAAEAAAAWINTCIRERGQARIVLSTGASQFEFFEHFVNQPVDWSAVEMFHLDEYLGLPDTHPASFRLYLRERFISLVPLGRAHLVDGDAAEPERTLRELERSVAEGRLDLGLIGIGENAHIAFNDPPADFHTQSVYKIVELDDDCKLQQVREGWFPSLADVPEQAITMTVNGIMSCSKIISVVPNEVKARAIRLTLESAEVTNTVPATMLKRHRDWSLYLDSASASQLPIRNVANPPVE